jgi:hypothetical protein
LSSAGSSRSSRWRRSWGGAPLEVAAATQLGDEGHLGGTDRLGVEVQLSPASCASLLHGQQPGGSWTRPPVPAARGGFGLLYGRPPLPPYLLPPPSSLLWWRQIWGEIHGRRGTGSCGWGLCSYMWPARVWIPRGTAGILGVRACGHAACIRGRRHGGGGSHGGCAAPCPTTRVTPVTGWKTRRKGEMGKGLTRGPHM